MAKSLYYLLFEDKLSALSLGFTEEYHISPSRSSSDCESRQKKERTGTSGNNTEQKDTLFVGVFREKQLKLGLGMTLQGWQVKHYSENFLWKKIQCLFFPWT